MTGIYTLSQIPVDDLINTLEIVQRKKGARKRKNEKEYLDIVTAFDIETTTIKIDDHSQSFMYIWQFQLGPDYTIIGRTWSEFDELCAMLRKIAEGVKHRLKAESFPLFVCYVHNLAFEWQFLQGVYQIENDNCFFRDVRKPLYVRFGRILELRCSYMHSNMTLAKFGENMGCSVQKLDGEKFDYDKVRYPWTELTEYELAYCVNDVRVLEEAIRREMDRDGDTLITIPLTSTGYVRRDFKQALKPMYFSIQQTLPDLETYNLLRRCFRGGDTHSNRYLTGRILDNVRSMDRASSYPAVMCTQKYPMGPFRKLDDSDNELERIIKLIGKGNAVIGDYTFKGLRLRDQRNPFPYIPLSKCTTALSPMIDNGRVLAADLLTIALTEIDLKIILDEYEFYTIRVSNAQTAVMGPLPKAARDVVMEYYTLKTELKGVAGKEYEYVKSKNKVNACYGMTVQQAVHPIIHYSQGEYIRYMPDEDAAEKELQKAPFPYQWGVYVTAHARAALRAGIACVPKDPKTGISNAVYVDTDSVKFMGDADFTLLNAKLTAEAKAAKAYATDKKGNIHYMGVFGDDGHYSKFITQGAKRYAYIYEGDTHIHCTVSGVSTKPTADDPKQTIAGRELGSLENFKAGFIWRDAGGLTAVYNDDTDIYYTDPETGGQVHITPNTAIVPTTYEMTMEDDYTSALEDAAEYLKFVKERGYILL